MDQPDCSSEQFIGHSQPLTAATVNEMMVVDRVETGSLDGVRLKRMGICQGRNIQVIHLGDPLIIHVVGCRVGISRRLAQQVFATACPGTCNPGNSAQGGV